MTLADRLRAQPWLVAAGAGALVGIAVGLFLPIRAASPPKADDAGWALPTRDAIKRFDEAKYQAVRRARFWGEISAPGARGPQAADWILGGIVTRPTVRIAVSAPGKPAVSWVRIGGEMPDGSTFVAATRDTVWYEKDGCRRARKLYVKPTAESNACIGAAGERPVAPSGKTTPVPATPPPAAPSARSTP